jgi:hypothetical protein
LPADALRTRQLCLLADAGAGGQGGAGPRRLLFDLEDVSGGHLDDGERERRISHRDDLTAQRALSILARH